jgi:hypothetical protein
MSTTELTHQYIKEHPHIKHCLKKGLINYSSLARLIAKELNIEKKSSKEAILIAARRFKESLKKETQHEKQVAQLLAESEVEVKNKIAVFIIKKDTKSEHLEKLQKEKTITYLSEGSDSYTLVTQEKHNTKINKLLKNNIIKKTNNLALITFKSPKIIEDQPGVIAYLTSLFAEHGVNIVELLSCWTDTLFVIRTEDVPIALQFLKF